VGGGRLRHEKGFLSLKIIKKVLETYLSKSQSILRSSEHWFSCEKKLHYLKMHGTVDS
jgi:hypothetical protein